MTPQQIELVRAVWARIETRREAAGRLFYDRLFAQAPALRPMFARDLDAQATKLMATLNVVVTNIDNLVPLLPPLRQLAVRHLDWQVRPEHYDEIGSALLWMLGEVLGEGLTPEARAAWEEAYDTLASAMKEAAYGRP